MAEVLPIFKKGDALLKENYRPVSILSHVSKIFERLLFNQIEKYFESINALTGFRKNHGTENALVEMIELWKKHLMKTKILAPFLWIYLKLLIH